MEETASRKLSKRYSGAFVAEVEPISGERGIGITKQPFLSMELAAESIRIQKAIKDGLDPRSTLNPLKIFE